MLHLKGDFQSATLVCPEKKSPHFLAPNLPFVFSFSYCKQPQQTSSKPRPRTECICEWSFQELYEGEESGIFDAKNGLEERVEFTLPPDSQLKTPAIGGDRGPCYH